MKSVKNIVSIGVLKANQYKAWDIELEWQNHSLFYKSLQFLTHDKFHIIFV